MRAESRSARIRATHLENRLLARRPAATCVLRRDVCAAMRRVCRGASCVPRRDVCAATCVPRSDRVFRAATVCVAATVYCAATRPCVPRRRRRLRARATAHARVEQRCE